MNIDCGKTITLWLALSCAQFFTLTADAQNQNPQKPTKPTKPQNNQASPEHAERAKKGLKIFKEEIRGILSSRCLKCHGGEVVKGGLNITRRESLLASGHVAKNAKTSRLLQLISHQAKPFMPLNGPALTTNEVQLITRWLEFGAPYDKPLVGSPPSSTKTIGAEERNHWSLKPLVRTQPPANLSGWGLTPIDGFIHHRFEQEQIHGNPLTSGNVLIRRAFQDLLGLPPTAEELATWSNRLSSKTNRNGVNVQEYGALIDYLLASNHYGERWARHWMDVARFAESHGYEQDYDRVHAYHYRDFLIRALNSDMPYNQFVQWQIAGDELAPDNPMALMATGFLGAGAFPTQLTEAEFEKTRYDELDDMVATTGVAFLGLSIGCARCHDHKFDPITSRDYYNMAAYFTSTIRSEIELDLHPVENRRRREEHQQKLAQLEEQIRQYETTALDQSFERWLAQFDPDVMTTGWTLLRPSAIKSSVGTKFVEQDDHSWLATGKAANRETLTVIAPVPNGTLRSIRLESLTHDSLPKRGPGRAANGNFALGDFTVHVLAPGQNTQRQLKNARATHQQNAQGLSVAASIDSDPVSGWAVDKGGIGKDQAAVFDFSEPIACGPEMQLSIKLVQNHPNNQHTIGRLRLSVTDQPARSPEVGGDGLTADTLALLQRLKESTERSDKDWREGMAWYRSVEPELAKLTTKLKELKTAGPSIQLTKVQVSSEGFPHVPHHADGRGYPHHYERTHVLNRGDVEQKKSPASPAYPEVFQSESTTATQFVSSPPKGWTRTSYRRVGLARWLTDSRNGAGHLAARVIVNRLWHHHFGRGIVVTTNDFGTQGERPTHPELLDWLAQRLIDEGWRLKPIHKLIMTSQVYMQSGTNDNGRLARDRENSLYWKRSPRRLEAEAIRDSMLSSSGLLDRSLYGPGTMDQTMRRRSIYFFIKRSKLIPTMMLFDWPEHLVSIGRRASTTIAPQSLMLMNSELGRSCAIALSKRLGSGGLEDQISAAYRLAFARTPTRDERELAMEFISLQSKRYEQESRNAPIQIALIDFCQTLYCMNEFVYID